jgi:hypothetical protein
VSSTRDFYQPPPLPSLTSSVHSTFLAVNLAIPEYTPESDPILSTVSVVAGSNFVVETVNLFLTVVHSSRGDLKITLTAPSGTASVVHPSKRPENSNSEMWKFISVKVWGEAADGDWTLAIEDESAGDLDTCVDVVWSVDNLDCGLLDSIGFCPDGIIGFPPDDPSLRDSNGLTPADACCSCFGGQPVASVIDMLQDWKLVVFGRDTPVPTDTPTGLTSSPEGLGSTSSPEGLGSTPSPSGVMSSCWSVIASTVVAAILAWNVA